MAKKKKSKIWEIVLRTSRDRSGSSYYSFVTCKTRRIIWEVHNSEPGIKFKPSFSIWISWNFHLHTYTLFLKPFNTRCFHYSTLLYNSEYRHMPHAYIQKYNCRSWIFEWHINISISDSWQSIVLNGKKNIHNAQWLIGGLQGFGVVADLNWQDRNRLQT